MSFNPEKEIRRLWKTLHAAQFEIGRNYFVWRSVAFDLLKDKKIKQIDISLRAARYFGKNISKFLLPKLNWLKGEDGFFVKLGNLIANIWVTEGGIAFIEESKQKGEIYVKCTRDPWPSWAKEYNVPMEELILCREMFLKSILEDIGLFFNISIAVEIQKSIPKGEGFWLIRLYKSE